MDDLDEIAKKAQGGDEEAIEYILNKYRGCIWKYVNQYYVKGGDYQDVYQEGLIAVWRAIKGYKVTSKCSFWTFANLCIKKGALDLVKKDNRIKHKILSDAIYTGDINNIRIAQIHPEKRVVNREKVKEILCKLSMLEYNVVMLYSVGFKINEISQILMVSKKKVDNTLQRVRKKAIKININSQQGMKKGWTAQKMDIRKGQLSYILWKAREKISTINKVTTTELTQLERDVAILREEGLSYRQIAQKLDISERSVDSALHRARKKGVTI